MEKVKEKCINIMKMRFSTDVLSINRFLKSSYSYGTTNNPGVWNYKRP